MKPAPQARIIALTGPSGVGKGSLALRLLAGTPGSAHLSTGDLFRENLEHKTALGLLARRYLDQRELVPDEIVEAMVEERLARLEPGQTLFLDGFPRTVYQAKFLDETLGRYQRKLDAVVYLHAGMDVLRNRLTGRLLCRACQRTFHAELRPSSAGPDRCDHCGGELYRREDDQPDLIEKRWLHFYRTSRPVLQAYADAGRLLLVNAAQEFETLAEEVRDRLDTLGTEGWAPTSPAALIQALDAIAPAAPVAPVPTVTGGLDLILLGGPGSGKGTQAEQLAREFKLPHVATGDLFRDNLRRETGLGTLARTYMNRGELVPDEITEAMVEERLGRDDTGKGFLLDGFPRTLPQAEALMDMLARQGRRPTAALYIDVPDEEIVNRLSGRLICRQCQTPFHRRFRPPREEGRCDNCGGELYQREDDQPETVTARLRTFHAQTEPLVEFFRRQGRLIPIDGTGKPAEVTGRTQAAVRQLAGT